MTAEEFYYEYVVLGRKMGDVTKEDIIDMLDKYAKIKQDEL